jgi:plastocyanin
VNRGAARLAGPSTHPLGRIVFRALMSLTPRVLAAKPRGHRSLRRRALRASTLALVGALALGAAGCSVKGADNANLIVGKQQFVAKCGSCHALTRARTKGTVGPNLDEAFRSAVAEAHGRSAIRGMVEFQVRYPNPEGVMPKDLVHGSVVQDVAAYVSQAVARAGPDTGLLATAVPLPGAGKPAAESAGKLAIPANAEGQLAYATNKATGTPGPVTITMANLSGVSHNIALEQGAGGATGGAPVLGASGFVSKGSASVSVSLKPGTYTFFCEVPGHRAAGMFGTLTVKK